MVSLKRQWLRGDNVLEKTDLNQDTLAKALLGLAALGKRESIRIEIKQNDINKPAQFTVTTAYRTVSRPRLDDALNAMGEILMNEFRQQHQLLDNVLTLINGDSAYSDL